MKKFYLIPLLLIALTSAAQRSITPSDVYKLLSISDPQVSPDGKWVAYVLSTPDSVKDKSDTDIWMVSWDGKEPVKLTVSKESESKPRWTPDGKYLTFMEKLGQVDESIVPVFECRENKDTYTLYGG